MLPTLPDRVFITTPIYYVNDKPHLGHAYTTIAADAAARWARMQHRDVWFQTGVDEYGQKVLAAATARGMTPQAHVDELQQRFRDLFARLTVRPDCFYRTTSPAHKAVVQAALQKLYTQGDLYLGTYAGWYSPTQERYFTEKDLVDGRDPVEGKPVEWLEEPNWFFRMSRYAPQLARWLDTEPDGVHPPARVREVRALLRRGVPDLCITRPRARMPWGIDVPFDSAFVTYVWFDALLNYTAGAGWTGDPAIERTDPGRFARWWANSVHLIGKDILVTHTLYWYSMLFALRLCPPKRIVAHGWWIVDGQKMSKSTGNAIDPHDLIDMYGVDAVRYFLLREMSLGQDANFTHKRMRTTVNTELADTWGNLAHRTLSMTHNWCGAVVPPGDQFYAWEGHVRAYSRAMASWEFDHATRQVLDLASVGHRHINDTAPWERHRQGDRGGRDAALRYALEICRAVGVLLLPFCPTTAGELLDRLGVPEEERTEGALYTTNCRLRTGAPVVLGDPLFPRLHLP